MKTPREILLAKHQTADAKLDKIRRAVINELTRKETMNQSFPGWLLDCSRNFLRELILPRPAAWATVAALWILIFALRFSTQDASPVAAKKSALSPEVVAELKQQKAFFGELAGLPPSPEVSSRKANPPGPRSARRLESFHA